MPHGKITQFLSKYCCCCTTGELDIDESKRPIARANGASNIRGQKNTRTSSRVDSTSQITSERKTTHLITETSVVSTPRTNTSGVETNASNTNVSYNKNATSASSNLQETMYGYNNRYDTSSNQNVQKETTTGTNSTSNTNVSSSTAQTAREANETARRTYYTDTSNRNNSQYESSIRTTTTSITRTSTLAPHGNNVSNNTTQNSTSTNSSRFQDTYRSTAANFNKLDLLTKLRHSSELIRPQSQTSVNSNSTSNAAPSNGIVLPVTFQKTADTTVQNQLPSMSNSEVTSTSTTTTIELPIAVITRHDNNSTQTAFVVASNEEKDVQPNDLALVQAHSERKDDDTSPTDNKHIFTQISEELSSSVLDDTTSLASNSVMEMSSIYDADEL
ncbi:MAG: hypothetical protein IT497_01265, partial [Ottowia sp.]|nr:hypothetical protein [Ottowia sp.]